MLNSVLLSSFTSEGGSAGSNISGGDVTRLLRSSSMWDSAYFYLAVYALINLAVVFLSFGREYYMRLRGLQASRTLFGGLLTAVLYAPMSFFDTTPLGTHCWHVHA